MKDTRLSASSVCMCSCSRRHELHCWTENDGTGAIVVNTKFFCIG